MAKFLGREIVIEVSDPWDYESPGGDNLIRARIVSFGTARWASCLVAEAPQEIFIRDVNAHGTRLIVTARYQGDRILDVTLGRQVMASIAVVTPGKSDTSAKFAIIGAVFLAGVESEGSAG